MATVELQGVTKTYDGKTQVLHGIDLRVAHGEFMVFVGPWGCGKSTLLRLIAGLEPISGGSVRIADRVVTHLPPRQRDIAMVFQDYALYPHKTLFENMAFGLRLRQTPEAEVQRRVAEAAALLKIEHLLQRRPRELSGGQRQRVAIGRAIVRQPQVFLFDEPLSNLDAQLRQEMRAEIKRLHQRLGATIIYVTHDQTEAMTLADRLCVLQAGRTVQLDTPEAVYNRPAATFVAGFTGAPAMNLARCTLGRDAVDLGGVRLPLPQRWAGRSGAHTLGLRPENLRLSPGSPEDLAWPATLQLVEPLGAETLITARIGSSDFIARVAAGFHQPHGTALTLHADPRHLHLFDGDSGLAVGR